MPIWHNKNLTLKNFPEKFYTGMVTHLGIQFTNIGDDFLEATMPVDERTKQTIGLLHGGASAVLIETLGSVASALCLDTDKQFPVGIEINVAHIRSVTEGTVTGRITPIKLGKSIHFWSGEIRNEKGDFTATGRLTVKILEKR